jgi:hypothetical protein
VPVENPVLYGSAVAAKVGGGLLVGVLVTVLVMVKVAVLVLVMVAVLVGVELGVTVGLLVREGVGVEVQGVWELFIQGVLAGTGVGVGAGEVGLLPHEEVKTRLANSATTKKNPIQLFIQASQAL